MRASSAREFVQGSSWWLTWAYGWLRGLLQPYWNGSFEATEILPGRIWLGGIESACRREELQQHGVTHIVSAVLGMPEIYPDDFTYLHVPLRDIPSEDIYPHLVTTSDAIRDILADPDARVFVHCVCGVSRSVTLLAAYLYRSGVCATPGEAVAYIKERRAIANPNPGFINALERLQAVPPDQGGEVIV